MSTATLRDEVTDLLQRLIRVDTTNPPGNETAAAELLRDYLEASGVSCQVIAKVPERGNLVGRIAGGAPGKKVSWRVEAIRNDKWVQQRRAPVEIEKQGPERGTYQHPELYGQPAERGINFPAAPERPSPPAVSDSTPH